MIWAVIICCCLFISLILAISENSRLRACNRELMKVLEDKDAETIQQKFELAQLNEK